MTKVIGGDFERKIECSKIGLSNCVYIFASAHPSFWFVKITGKAPENPGKAAPNVVWFQKVASKVYGITHEDLFWRLY